MRSFENFFGDTRVEEHNSQRDRLVVRQFRVVRYIQAAPQQLMVSSFHLRNDKILNQVKGAIHLLHVVVKYQFAKVVVSEYAKFEHLLFRI